MNIWQVLITGTTGILSSVIDLFPEVDPVTLATFTRELTNFRSYLSSASWFFPVNELLFIVGVIISIEAGLFTYRLIKFIVNHITLGFIGRT